MSTLRLEIVTPEARIYSEDVDMVTLESRAYGLARHIRRETRCSWMIVNDVAGFRDPAMIQIAKEFDCGIVVMHMKGDPRTMQLEPMAANAVEEIGEFFDERISTLIAAGLHRDSLCLDPGIGFGKTLEQTLQQLKRLSEYQRFQLPICLGVSRKGFLGQITGRTRPDRLAGSLAIACFAVAQGAAQVLRVHDVASTRDAVLLWEAMV